MHTDTPVRPICCASRTRGPVVSLLRRVLTLLEWALPIAMLVLIPKCPACLAAYALLFTGLSLSLAVAGVIRWIFLSLCVLAIVSLLIRAARRVLRLQGVRERITR